MEIKRLKEEEDWENLSRLEEKWDGRMCCDLYYEMDVMLVERSEVESELGVKIGDEFEDEFGMVLIGWYEGWWFVVKLVSVFEEISKKLDEMRNEEVK